MALNLGIQLIQNNLGVTFENIILFVVLIGCLIFYAKDFKLGLILTFILSGLLFMWFYYLNLNWVNSLVVTLMSIVGLAFSVFATGQKTTPGVI